MEVNWRTKILLARLPSAPQIPNFLETFNSNSIEFSSLVDILPLRSSFLFSEKFLFHGFSVIESFFVR